jgi:hypothetical protein
MALALTILVFLSVVAVIFSFGAAAYAPSSVLGARLRETAGKAAHAGTHRAGARSPQQSHSAFAR